MDSVRRTNHKFELLCRHSEGNLNIQHYSTCFNFETLAGETVGRDIRLMSGDARSGIETVLNLGTSFLFKFLKASHGCFVFWCIIDLIRQLHNVAVLIGPHSTFFKFKTWVSSEFQNLNFRCFHLKAIQMPLLDVAQHIAHGQHSRILTTS